MNISGSSWADRGRNLENDEGYSIITSFLLPENPILLEKYCEYLLECDNV
jgi:hypothetical protein